MDMSECFEPRARQSPRTWAFPRRVSEANKRSSEWFHDFMLLAVLRPGDVCDCPGTFEYEGIFPGFEVIQFYPWWSSLLEYKTENLLPVPQVQVNS